MTNFKDQKYNLENDAIFSPETSVTSSAPVLCGLL